MEDTRDGTIQKVSCNDAGEFGRRSSGGGPAVEFGPRFGLDSDFLPKAALRKLSQESPDKHISQNKTHRHAKVMAMSSKMSELLFQIKA